MTQQTITDLTKVLETLDQRIHELGLEGAAGEQEKLESLREQVQGVISQVN